MLDGLLLEIEHARRSEEVGGLVGWLAWLGLAVFINCQVGSWMVCFCNPSTIDALEKAGG